MDEQFLKDRARIVRDLADQADPFIKQRLLDLAERYERRIGQPSQAIKTPLSSRLAE